MVVPELKPDSQSSVRRKPFTTLGNVIDLIGEIKLEDSDQSPSLLIEK